MKNEMKYAVTFGGNGSLDSLYFSNKKEAIKCANSIKKDFQEVYLQEQRNFDYQTIRAIKN